MDKIFHFFAGAIITLITWMVLPDHSVMIAVIVGWVAGLAKELYDIGKSGFDLKDLFATCVGSLLTAIAIVICSN